MDIVVETAVSNVAVYPDRARVTLHGRCDLQGGRQRLLINELPLSMIPDSVRAAGQGSAQVRILSVDIGRQFYEETPASKVRELEAAIESLEDELRVVTDGRTRWQAQADYLDGVRQATAQFAKGLARGRLQAEDQVALLQSMQEQHGQVQAELRAVDLEERNLQRQLEKLRQEWKNMQSARGKQRYQARIDVEVLAAGQFEPTLSYLVKKASWQPLYDVRLQQGEGEGAQIVTTMLASVSQQTGQDWQDVQLTLSTARPALNQRLPELKPWFIDITKPLPRKPVAMAARSVVAQAETAVPEAAAPAAVEAAEVATATVNEGRTAVSFTPDGAVDIPSDGSPYKTTLLQFSSDPQLDYLSVPKHTDAVYRRATVVNNSAGSLLAGSVNLFADEAFIGRTKIGYTPVGDEIKLLLGVEERIVIERELSKRDVGRRLLGDTRRLRYGYEIRLKNLLPRRVQVEIQDHIPVSRHEQIKVKLEQADPEPDSKSDLNLLEWQLTLESGGKSEITYEYSVVHPRESNVTGLLD